MQTKVQEYTQWPVEDPMVRYSHDKKEASVCQWLKDTRITDPHTHRVMPPTSTILPDILYAVGNTPMVMLNRVHLNSPAAVNYDLVMAAKCEFMNPGGSVKDRIAHRMIQDAESSGILIRGKSVLVEPTSGNTGIGLALAGAVRGYRVIIVLPEKMSNEKISVLKALGSEIIRTRTSAAHDDPDSHISIARKIARETPNAVILDQYANASNPLAHYDGTAQEILDSALASGWKGGRGRPFDVFVAGAGTGGTITGIARKFKERYPSTIIVGVDPIGSILARPEALNTEGQGRAYEVEGTGYDFVPKVLDHSTVDAWIKVDDEASFRMSRRIIREEGLLVGGSSGGTMAGALAWLDTDHGRRLLEEQRRLDEPSAASNGHHRQTVRVVVLLADGIRNYLTKFVQDDWFNSRYSAESG